MKNKSLLTASLISIIAASILTGCSDNDGASISKSYMTDETTSTEQQTETQQETLPPGTDILGALNEAIETNGISASLTTVYELDTVLNDYTCFALVYTIQNTSDQAVALDFSNFNFYIDDKLMSDAFFNPQGLLAADVYFKDSEMQKIDGTIPAQSTITGYTGAIVKTSDITESSEFKVALKPHAATSNDSLSVTFTSDKIIPAS